MSKTATISQMAAFLALSSCSPAAAEDNVLTRRLSGLPIQARPLSTGSPTDYLIDSSHARAAAYRDADGKSLILDNQLIRRTWRLVPDGACVAFDNLITGQSMLRSVRPEARLTVDGSSHLVGGLEGQPNHAYLTPEWLESMTPDSKALHLVDFEITTPQKRLAWKQVRHHAHDARWPPRGVALRMDYELPGDAGKFRVSVHYEIYDGVPVMSKWITVHNKSQQTITIDRLRCEELAVVEHANWVETRAGVAIPAPDYLHVETDFAFGGFNPANANRHVVHWRTDPLYSTQVNYLRQTPCLLVAEPTYGPTQRIEAGAALTSFRTFELVYDSSERERRGLALKRMYRTIAPWVTENPLTHHLLSSDPQTVRRAIDQAVEVGFEAIILSFGSGFKMESTDRAYLEEWRQVAEYAAKRGIELGSYSLFSSRRIGGGNDIVSPPGQKPTHGNCPAATSEWGLAYYQKLRDFYDFTGFDQFENDGPYPGDVDITSRPPHQLGEQDSRWAQWRIVTGLYRHLRASGVYINAPDFYYLSGTNKCGMGYREVNWSLPREQQVLHTRQNIFDGTWTKTPSMGWMFVPLTQYHGGGAAATIEPLGEHIEHYERLLLSNLGMGVQAHYRGPRLFDSTATRDRVRHTVKWFKKYRDILEADFVHGRRADGRDVDWILHVDPRLRNKGLLCVYNPLPVDVTRTLQVGIYYTGIQTVAQVLHEGHNPRDYPIPHDGHLRLPVEVGAGGMTWFVIR